MASNVWSEDKFSCPVCLDLLKNPVSIPCGHSYCMGCIKNYWDQAVQTGVYSCPQCRETFTPRPVLRRNTMLAELVEHFKTTQLNPPPAQSYAGPGDVPCDLCTGRKFKAVNSCLTCLVSYCETHVKPHLEVAALKRHKLIEATGNLEQKICAEHQKVLEGFCRTDQTCICWSCTDKEHKNHDTVSAEKERTLRQAKLGDAQKELELRIQERLKELEELKQAVESLKRSSQREIQESEKIFTQLIRSIEKIRSEVMELIGAQEKATVNQAEGIMKKLEQEIAELRRRNTELKQLSETKDHIHFLQNFQSLCAPPEAAVLPSIKVNSDISFGAVRKAVSQLKDYIEDFCKGKLAKITTTVKEEAVHSLQASEPGTRAGFLKLNETAVYTLGSRSSGRRLKVNEVAVHSLQAPEPRSRADFLKYSCRLTLDPNTAHRELYLSEGNRKVTWRKGESQPYPDHPERFDYWWQVLCREGLSGTRCYWEIEWSGERASIGVTYKGINRKRNDHLSGLGYNEKSWSLVYFGSNCSVWHNYIKTAIIEPHFPRIGVYLDFNGGALSFYGVSDDTMTLLHRFQTTFTEPLYPGFGPNWWSECPVTICQLK
ncbi:tripartite motif-containing protein 16-like protein isoform X2 [Acipenser ruthenus]|uniref:tripartite motif-containing protein 16-like protein isoform X2 n=1 Tax=Acipenser ruthenus TaxID=7906 RepID=UPI0027403265|nr:tripartite motif-containing protein 16-like protein isoform X2 [Acipenser ruthenus]